jgi:beta-amylase
MNKVVEFFLYAYLAALAVFCVGYGVFVVTQSGAFTPGVNVNVKLPANVVTVNSTISNITQLTGQLALLKNSSAKGVVLDVWWGLVEVEPQQYNWTLYDELFALLNETGLRVKASLAFHACDSFSDCDFQLPSWLDQVDNPEAYYQDKNGNIYSAYLSSGVDYKPIFPGGRTAVGMYTEFILNFAEHFSEYFDSLIYEVKVGLGPNGELAYPAFPADWEFPGIGEFMCYDSYLLAEYAFYAAKAGHLDWGFFPNGTGTYNSVPDNTTFFAPISKTNTDKLNYASDYGQFFLEWYSNRLVTHGQAILANAVAILNGYSPNVTVAAQIGCVYWQYFDPSHAAELTSGYKNDNGTAYDRFAEMFEGLGVTFDFGCFEMWDKQFPSNSSAGPAELVYQTLQTAQNYGVRFEGHNTHPVYSQEDYNQIEKNCRRDITPIYGFDFRDLEDALVFNADNFTIFKKFVSNLESEKKK